MPGCDRRDRRGDHAARAAALPLRHRRGARIRTGDEHRRHRIDARRHAEMPQRRLGDPLEDRRRHHAAGVAVAVRRVDDDDDGQRRLPRRDEADERGVVVRTRVVAVDQLRRGAGLAGDGVAVDLRQLRGAAFDDSLHHRPSARPASPATRSCGSPWRRPSTRRPSLMNGAHHARLHQRPAVGDRAHGRRHLQRRHADLVSHRHRRQRAVDRAWPDSRRCPELSPRKSGPIGWPNPNRLT